jgi:hypothetical protein
VSIQPPPDRLYAVRAVLPGPERSSLPPAEWEALTALGKALRSKGSESLRQRCSGLEVAHLRRIRGDAAEVTAMVNEWNAGAAAMRVVTLLVLKAGAGWDTVGMSVSAEPVRSRTDSIDQERTTTSAA